MNRPNSQVKPQRLRRVVYMEPEVARSVEEILVRHYAGTWGGWQVFIHRAIQGQLERERTEKED